MKVKPINPFLGKVVAVMTVPDRRREFPSDLVEAPKGKSDKELVGSFVSLREEIEGRPEGRTLFVIPTYSGGGNLERCLRTLRERHEGRMDFEVVVSFDGGPNPEEARRIAFQNNAKFVFSGENGGFSKAVNRGIRAADSGFRHVILVNDDVWFETPAGKILALTMDRHTDTGVVGALILYEGGKIQHAGKFNAYGHRFRGEELREEAFEEREIPAVTGAFLGISHGFLEQVGGLDEGYRMAWEDTDLCLTAWMLGWKVRYCGKAWVFHKEGGTRGTTLEEKGSGSRRTWLKWEMEGKEKFERKWGVEYSQSEWKDIPPRRTKLRRLVVKRSEAWGDVFLTTPVVRALREKNPDWEIVVATKLPEVFRDNPDVTYVIGVEHRWVKKREAEAFFDLDLAYEKTPEKAIVQAFADVCGVEVRDARPKLFIREAERGYAAKLLPEGHKWAVIHWGPKGWPGGDWGEKRFSELSKELQRRGWKTVLVGRGDGRVEGDVDLRNRTTIHQLAAVIERAGVFVGVDSFPMHVAAAVGKPTVGIFGSVDPERVMWKYPAWAVGVTADPVEVDCLGCHHRQSPPVLKSRCHRDRVYCMEKLGVGRVLEAVDRAFKEAAG